MKNQVLSIEQMQKLKELGVDTSKASMCYISKYPSCDFDDGDSIVVVSKDFNKRLYNEFGPAFTLQDIVELLPKSISHKYEVLSIIHEDTYVLVWDMEGGVLKYCDDIGCEREYTNHAIIHVNEIGVLESLYEMLIWVAENGYLTAK